MNDGCNVCHPNVAKIPLQMKPPLDEGFYQQQNKKIDNKTDDLRRETRFYNDKVKCRRGVYRDKQDQD